MERVYRKQFELLAGPFSDWPDLPCLICHLGALEPHIEEFESKESIDNRVGAEIWDRRKSGFFHGELRCSRTMCGNKYAVAGEWIGESTDAADEKSIIIAHNQANIRIDVLHISNNEDLSESDPNLLGFTVRHILPPLPLIALPDKTPSNVRVLIDSASSVLLSDPSAAATRIRIAVEALLDKQGIRKTVQGNRSTRLNTHSRIELFRSVNMVAADQLMAVKWIGNVASHEKTPLPLEFVLDGIELFALAIELIYSREAIELNRRAAQINRRGRNLRATRLPRRRAR